MKATGKKRTGKPDPAILVDIVRRVVEAAAPEKIVLFGSAARGEMGPDSDYDLLVIKGGKFQLKDANGNVVQAASVPLWVTPVKTGTMSQTVDEQVYTDPPTSGQTFRWDGSQYIYNWQSPKDAGSLYRICAKFDDGQTQCVNLGLK